MFFTAKQVQAMLRFTYMNMEDGELRNIECSDCSNGNYVFGSGAEIDFFIVLDHLTTYHPDGDDLEFLSGPTDAEVAKTIEIIKQSQEAT